jgi:hypothetical protein
MEQAVLEILIIRLEAHYHPYQALLHLNCWLRCRGQTEGLIRI